MSTLTGKKEITWQKFSQSQICSVDIYLLYNLYQVGNKWMDK